MFAPPCGAGVETRYRSDIYFRREKNEKYNCLFDVRRINWWLCLNEY